MKKSVIKRRKRVVPASGEPEFNQSRLNSFPASPSTTPPVINTQDAQGRPRLGSTMDTHSPLDIRPNIHHHDPMDPSSKPRAQSTIETTSSHHLEMRQRGHPLEHQLSQGAPPIGVDFTGYQLDQRREQQRRNPSIPQLPPLSSIHDPSILPPDSDGRSRLSPLPSTSRKRSHSNTDEGSTPSPSRAARLSSISSILNHPQQASGGDELPIDPNLAKLPPHLQQHRHSTPLPHNHSYQISGPPALTRPSTSSDPGSWELIQKRDKVRREAEELRQALIAKERELAELERIPY